MSRRRREDPAQHDAEDRLDNVEVFEQQPAMSLGLVVQFIRAKVGL